ncbi:MAG: Holliday junction branch migration protein RuvA [Gemmatimonadetes bacterium]|jgi:Holliday junction DNA helicase RuvA|nr:Holliday junction branch migration protein RuvA [Gemmatimonadota bacterium]MCS5555262.1 Holliday junction branch migration protein RuvA [Arenicellales bacterium]MEC9354869.1 Holliday junction branch migration protein RuvA [Gemmatimonadota bacterium]GIT51658.1 MAG: Holliday junction ATP-dependent DNA helicase RuvA [Gemmatimonadota bacterium]HCK89578.1 Holliday junction branch migration protein RuvA [Gemmatimonadota bacterium]|tara:strand:+ start:183 stop:767 length:585 start_codon:yes stop_codon:yes gene_type:complete
MISRLQGKLLSRDAACVEVETSGGVVYEVEVPITVLQGLPSPGGSVELRTLQVVTESSIALYGFSSAHERLLFQRLLTATGVGAKLALAMMSTYSVERLARALVEKDSTALQQVSGIGKKKAEKIALDLADKVADLAIVTPVVDGVTGGAQDAVQALVNLGYSFSVADTAVRAVLEDGIPDSTEELVRRALSAT